MNSETNNRLWLEARDLLKGGDAAGAAYKLKRLAKEGSLSSYRELGNLYESGGVGFAKDYERAKHWYTKALDEADDAFGAFGLGKLFYFGSGVKRDYEKAYHYFKIASDAGIDIAHLRIGIMLYRGEGIKSELDQAIIYFEKCAVRGNIFAQIYLGVCRLTKGDYVKGILSYIAGWSRRLFYSSFRKSSAHLKRI